MSGIAVAIGLAALIVFEADALRSMGIGGVVVVVATMLFGLTVLPALLGMLGHRVNRLKVPMPRASGSSRTTRSRPSDATGTASGRGSRPGSCGGRC